MKIASASCANTSCAVAAFESNGTKNPNAIMAVNTMNHETVLDIKVTGGGKKYHVYQTTADTHFEDLGTVEVKDGIVMVNCPADSATTLVEE